MNIIIPWFLFFLFTFLFPLYSQNLSNGEPSIKIISRKDCSGEREFSERIKIACENLNWKVDVLDLHTLQDSDFDSDYDWILTLVPENYRYLRDNYLTLFDPEHHYFDANKHLRPEYMHYSGYLTTYSNVDHLLEDVNYQKDRFYPKRWYPTAYYRPYVQVNPTSLFFIIGHWGARADSWKYLELQFNLSKKPYANFFGNPILGAKFGNAFKGTIEFDGKSIINRISELGVCLILHSETHLQYGIPSGRIFEAFAASAVIISDLNPFVIEHFGDTVLYVNQNLSGRQICRQIDKHMLWIKQHPDMALKMAQKSHQIFEEKFLLEHQLLDFYEYHRSNH